MTNSSTPEFNKPDYHVSKLGEPTSNDTRPLVLTNDPEYSKLFEYYQNGKFSKCMDVIEGLEKQYPEHPELLRFKDDLQMKLSLKSMAVTNKKEENTKKAKVTLKMSVFVIASTVFVLIVFLFSYYYLSEMGSTQHLAKETAQLNSLNSQVEELLLVGQPQAAAEIIEMIRLINPDYENLEALTLRAEDLLRLEDRYQTALGLLSDENESEALAILNEIKEEQPGLWDVNQQIALIETSLQITEYLEEGSAAYQAEDWGQVISAYENALLLNPKLDDPLVTEQLLKGYLNKIISLLQNENTTIDDVENAETYYRKAVALIPQSKEYASERGNLQEVSSNLLELKFTQTAKLILGDKNQTVSTIANAVSYLEKAANIEANNTAMQLDLQNAEYYQIAFQDFIEMNWSQAISKLDQILSVDSNYADGNASILLFEAYYALGKQYYSSGFYQDALYNLEQAEILTWNDTDNLTKLFQVQVLIGDTYGEMHDYQNADSYYQYALNAIEVFSRLAEYPDATIKFSEAVYLTDIGNYEDAFAAYQEVLESIDIVYTVSEIEVSDGICLAFFADENLSTMDAVIEENKLTNSVVITFGRSLLVPTIEK